MRIVPVLVILVSVGCALSCEREKKTEPSVTAAQTTAPKPKKPTLPPNEVAIRYYDAMTAGRYQDAYDMVSEADRAAKPVEEFRAAASDSLQVATIKRRQYEVKDVVVEETKARVDIDTTGPDIATLQKIVMADFQKNGGTPPEAGGIKRALEVAIERDKAPMVVTNNSLYFVLEAGEWKLDFDWDGERPNRIVPLKRPVTKDAGSGAD